MTQEDKELLLKDLCARLPYGVIIQEYNEEYGYADNALNTIGMGYFSIHEACIEGTWINHIENVRPYLRPMSSMTEEEDEEFKQILEIELDYIASNEEGHTVKSAASSTFAIDFYNRHHFDYRGLIERGLAIAVTEDNPYKEK